MNVFNRIAMIFLLLWGTAAALFTILAALLFPGETIAFFQDFIGALGEGMTPGLQILIASVAALVAFVGFLLLLLEVMPRAAKGVLLTGVSGASAQLTLDAIVDRIRYEVESVPSVRQARPVVASRGREIDVDLLIRTDPNVDATAKTEEVSQVVHDTVENKIGIRLHRLRISVQHDPYPRGAKGRAASSQPPASEPRPPEVR